MMNNDLVGEHNDLVGSVDNDSTPLPPPVLEPIKDETLEVKIAEIAKIKPSCKVFLADKVHFCGQEATEIIALGDIVPPALIPICEAHNKRLEQGTGAFLMQEIDGERNFAMQYNWDKNDKENAS